MLGNRATNATTFRDYGIYVEGNIARVVDKDNKVGTINWRKIIESYPGQYRADVSEIRLRTDTGFIVGTFTLNPLDENQISVNWDADTLPSGDVIDGPARSVNSWTSFDKVIDPLVYNPTADKVPGFRVLTLGDINNSQSVGDSAYDGPDAWKNADGTDFVCGANDLIEWTGTSWVVVMDATDSTNGINSKNLNTNIIYKWTGEEWLQAYEGYYPVGTWDIYLDA